MLYLEFSWRSVLKLSFEPMLLAVLVGAYKDELNLVTNTLCEGDSFVMAAIWTGNVTASGQCGVFDALGIDFHLLSTHCELSPVDTIFHLVVITDPYCVVANLAFESQVSSVILVLDAYLFCVKHIVTL